MTIVKRAQALGFCYGVRRAIKWAEEALKREKDVYVIGDLIHNAGEMQRLREKGLRVVDGIEQIPPGACMLVRAHGEDPEVIEKAKNKGIKVIDCTCSRVRRAQETALQLFQQGKKVLIFGDRNHPEVQGILGYIRGEGIVIESAKDTEGLDLREGAGLVCQTTKGGETFFQIASLLRGKIKDLVIHDTSCPEVEKRKEASRRLTKMVDLMIIVGGARSANTLRLKEVCEREGVECHLVERGEEVKEEWLKGKKRIGITAGLSTPLWEIEEVERTILEKQKALSL